MREDLYRVCGQLQKMSSDPELCCSELDSLRLRVRELEHFQRNAKADMEAWFEDDKKLQAVVDAAEASRDNWRAIAQKAILEPGSEEALQEYKELAMQEDFPALEEELR